MCPIINRVVNILCAVHIQWFLLLQHLEGHWFPICLSVYLCIQLQLPEQTEEIHWLTFGPVEEYFYKRQQEMCTAEATRVMHSQTEIHTPFVHIPIYILQVISRLSNNYTLSSLTQDTVQKVSTR